MVRELYKTTKAKFHRVKRHWLTVAFFLGFILDNITLNRVDQVFDNIVLFTYVVLAMVGLLLMYASAAEKLSARVQKYAQPYSPLLIQYAFGGLLSGMLIFYGKSGSWFESWPYLLIILVIIYGNETIRDRSRRLVFNVSVLFVTLFSYVVLVVPVLIGKMGAWVFVGSGLLALGIMYWFLRVLYSVIPRFFSLHARSVIFVVGTIYVSFNFLYFTNIIPPIPLSLKDIGIYHSVERLEDDNYKVVYEKPPWWLFLRDSDKTFHFEQGDYVYCYASVFAPARLKTDIYHRWEYFDEKKDEWVPHGERLSYPIEGGRGGGFRGFTRIQNYSLGTWRCTAETGRGQVIGRETFDIEEGPQGELVTKIK